MLQFCLQLFGEDGYTRKLPLEIEASEKDKFESILVFKRKILAADVGWVSWINIRTNVLAAHAHYFTTVIIM
jgi:hypothetical protein